MRNCWMAWMALVCIGLMGCRKETTWRQVDSSTGLYSFQFPDGWVLDPSSTEQIVTYRNPATQGQLTLSGYWGVEADEILKAAWTGVAPEGQPVGTWKRADGIEWHRYEQRIVSGTNATDLVVIYGETKTAVIATLIDSLDAMNDHEAVYRHILSAVTLHPRAKRPR